MDIHTAAVDVSGIAADGAVVHGKGTLSDKYTATALGLVVADGTAVHMEGARSRDAGYTAIANCYGAAAYGTITSDGSAVHVEGAGAFHSHAAASHVNIRHTLAREAAAGNGAGAAAVGKV